MSLGTACKVYEQLAETELADEGIRPGGLELTERALACCNFHPNSRILDVGCGSGVTLNELTLSHGFSPIGVDASGHLLNQAHLRHRTLRLVRAAGEKLPIAEEFADGIIAECALSVMDLSRALDEFRRVLKIGGRLILSDVYSRNPEGAGDLKRIPLECCLRGAVSKEELLSRLTNRGFRVDLWEDHSDLLANFAVKLIFSYGSMNRFWLRTGSGLVDPGEIQRAVSKTKPGYFLLIAHKVAVAETLAVSWAQ